MIYFLVPVFNEAENIPDLAESIRSVLPEEKKFFVFVNDGSSDNTNDAIAQHFPKEQHIVLNNAVNSGPGYSFNEGFEWILARSENSDDLIVSLEGDNTSDLGILPVMYSLAKNWNYDLVLSSVYAQGGGFSKTSFFRKLSSLIANQLMRFVFDIKVLTLTSFYRVYKISLVRKIKAKYGVLIHETGFICKLEILIKAIRSDAQVIEVPMVLNAEARKGKSKMKILKTLWRYIRFLAKRNF